VENENETKIAGKKEVWKDKKEEVESFAISKTAFEDYMNRSQIPKKRKAKALYHPSELPAVQVPSHGLSYNPDPKGHQNALGESTAFIVARRRKQEKLNKLLAVPKYISAEEDEEDNGEEHVKAYFQGLTDGSLRRKIAARPYIEDVKPERKKPKRKLQ